ncbi:DNA polymerase IV [Deinococcus aquiradiocola]|nr:DNA polymerase IV [Deinococcus aquiradiocola]
MSAAPTTPAAPDGRGVVRRIVHVDMDAFYASVEVRDRPELRGLPVAVAHDSRRGVVLTASYEARTYGVRSAMPTRMAQARCPHLILVPPRMDVYRQVSERIRAVFARYTDLVEPLSLDEAYLDVTDPREGPRSGTLIARAVKADILRETGLTASAGVSHTKFLAKVASDLHKPDGLTVIRPEEAQAVIDALPIAAFHGVGPATARRMAEHGIRTGADLRAQTLADLRAWFGAHGEHYHRVSRGVDERPVAPDRERKSVGVERTFETDLRTLSEVRAALPALAAALAVRAARAGYAGRSVVLKLKFADHSVVTRRTGGAPPAPDAAQFEALGAALLTPQLLAGRRVRLVGLSVTGHVPDTRTEPLQPRLFPLP